MPFWIGEASIAALAVLTGFLFWLGSFQFAGTVTGIDIGPAFFPKALSILLMLIGSFLFLKNIAGRHLREGKSSTKKVSLKTSVGMLLSVIYIYLIPVWGYFYATACFCPVILFYQGYRKVRWITAVTVSFLIMAYLVFYRFLSVALPV